jgi:hypothetical protein
LAVALGGCAATQQARKVEPSGFLGNYAQLQEGGEGEAKLVYIDRTANWAGYDKMMIDPVTIWYDADASNVPKEEAQVLADYLDASLRHHLKQDYALVDRPGPGVLRLRVAMTEAQGAKTALNLVSTVVPQLRALSTVKKIATGTHAFVGRAGVEAEILDSMSNRRLAAAVDRRVGGKTIKGATSTWDDVQKAFDYWSERIQTRLAELRGA